MLYILQRCFRFEIAKFRN